MHDPVIQRLEEYLAGDGPFADAEKHLADCPDCRKELDVMRRQSSLFQSLRVPGEVEPRAGFYARVIDSVDSQTRPSIWSLFGESLFAKRLAYASVTCLLLLGTVLVSSTQPQEALEASAPESILAGEPDAVRVSMDNPQQDRDVVLVNLATYRQDYQ